MVWGAVHRGYAQQPERAAEELADLVAALVDELGPVPAAHLPRAPIADLAAKPTRPSPASTSRFVLRWVVCATCR